MKFGTSAAAVCCIVMGVAGIVSTGCSGTPEAAIDSGEADLTANTVGTNKGVMWGINGHFVSDTKSLYQRIPIEQQMKTTAALGLHHFRTNISTLEPERTAYLVKALIAAKANGILLTPVLTPPLEGTEHDTYWNAYDMAFAYAERFRGAIPVWELGNEENHAVISDAFSDNSDPAKFKQGANYPRVLARFRGLVDGVRAADQTAKIAIGDSGGCNYGFTQALYDDGVRWDVTIVHAYDFFGDIDNRFTAGVHCVKGDNIIAKHAAFGKPVWITEFNYSLAVSTPNKTNMGTHLQSMMNKFESLAAKYDIEVADVYELYDESTLTGVKEDERHFGIYDKNAAATDASRDLHDQLVKHPSGYYSSASNIKTAYLAPFSLGDGQSIVKNGLELVMGTDGNLVLGDKVAERGLWATHTPGAACKGACVAKFQTDGNLVLYRNNQPYWQSNTTGKGVNAMILSTSGHPVELKKDAALIWSTEFN